MADKWIEVSPKDVIWKNLDVKIASYVAYGLTADTLATLGWRLRGPHALYPLVGCDYSAHNRVGVPCRVRGNCE
jgi:hypothetical protein